VSNTEPYRKTSFFSLLLYGSERRKTNVPCTFLADIQSMRGPDNINAFGVKYLKNRM
jgi:hypothetical protein